MSWFGNLFGRKTKPTANASARFTSARFKSEADFLGGVLLWQFVGPDRPLISEESVASATRNVTEQHRKLVVAWIMIYVAWRFRLAAQQRFGDEFGREMMAAVYRLIAANEVPGFEPLAQVFKYWFSELDDQLQDATANPSIIDGELVPFACLAGLRFITCDGTSPYADSSTMEFNGFDQEVTMALAEAQDASEPGIDLAFQRAKDFVRQLNVSA